jgi:hypothetical protein
MRGGWGILLSIPNDKSGQSLPSSSNRGLLAVALAGAVTCSKDGESTDAKAQTFAKAIAKAVARAVIEIDKSCISSKKAGFCSFIEGSITAHAKALATAFASAWAGTPSGCDCEISVEAISTTMTPIFATATRKIHQEKCIYGGFL